MHAMTREWGARVMPWAPVVLRIVAGIIFVYAGWMKFGDMEKVVEGFGSMGIPAATFFAYLVTIIEFFGGIALIAGLWTRVAAKFLGIIMIVATIVMLGNGFAAAQLPLTLFAVCLTLFAMGGGRYSMDKS